MSSFITHYGLIAILIGAAVEGDGTLLLGGVTAHLGLLHLPSVLIAGALGGYAGDLALYSLGRSQAVRVGRSAAYRRVGPTIERLADRFGPWQIVSARFIYGTRNASMVFWGLRGLPLGRFAFINGIGVSLWASSLTAIGYAFSGSAQALLGEVKTIEQWLLGAALIIILALLLAHLTRKRE